MDTQGHAMGIALRACNGPIGEEGQAQAAWKEYSGWHEDNNLCSVPGGQAAPKEFPSCAVTTG